MTEAMKYAPDEINEAEFEMMCDRLFELLKQALADPSNENVTECCQQTEYISLVAEDLYHNAHDEDES